MMMVIMMIIVIMIMMIIIMMMLIMMITILMIIITMVMVMVMMIIILSQSEATRCVSDKPLAIRLETEYALLVDVLLRFARCIFYQVRVFRSMVICKGLGGILFDGPLIEATAYECPNMVVQAPAFRKNQIIPLSSSPRRG